MVLAALKKYAGGSVVVAKLVADLEYGNVHAEPFRRFDGHTVADVRAYMAKRGALAAAEPTREAVVRAAKKAYYGWIRGDTLYYRDGLRGRALVDTLVHEYVHWLRKRHGLFRYGTPREVFVEEALAELVARSVFRSGKSSTPDTMDHVARYVTDKYKLEAMATWPALLAQHAEAFDRLLLTPPR